MELHLDEESSPRKRRHKDQHTTTFPSIYTPLTPQRAGAVGRYRYLKPSEVGEAYDFALIVKRARRETQTVCCCISTTKKKKTTAEDEKGILSHCLQSSTRLLQESEGDYHRQIVDKLCTQGLLVDIIDGGHSEGEEITSDYFILLIRASERVFQAIKREYKLKSWTSEGNISDFAVEFAEMNSKPTPAERIEMVHDLVKNARFTELDYEWILDMFPVHDVRVTDNIVKNWIFSFHERRRKNDPEFVNSIRYNFGEKVAYYFAFITFYNKSLLPIALVGLFLSVAKATAWIDTITYMRLLPLWGIIVCVLWSFSFLKRWDRESAVLQFQWNQKIHVRPPRHANPSYNEAESSSYKRLYKYGAVLVFMILQTLVMLTLVALWVSIYEVIKVHYPDQTVLASTGWFLILLEGMVFGFFVDVIQWNIVVLKVGKFFTRWENYKTEEEFESSLIRKLFVMDFLNYYTWFFSLAFVFVIPGFGNYLTNYMNTVFFRDESNCCFGPFVNKVDGSCIACPTGDPTGTCIECRGWFTFDIKHVNLSTMFVTPIVVTQALNIALTLVVPWIVNAKRTRARKIADDEAHAKVVAAGSMKILGSLDYGQGCNSTSNNDNSASAIENQSNARYLEYTAAELEVLNKKARDIIFESEQDSYDPYNDFHVLTVQFGFTVMFSMLWPLMPLACYVINVIKIRTDGYRLCRTLKRPFPRKAAGIGDWRTIFYCFAFIAIGINAALVCVSTGTLEFYNPLCVKDITHQLEKDGKTLEDFVMGPDFSCMHFTWRLVIMIVAEHILVAIALCIVFRVPGIPKWVTARARRREQEFKNMIKDNSEALELDSLSEKPTTTTAMNRDYSLTSTSDAGVVEIEMTQAENNNSSNSKTNLAQKWSTEE